MKKINGWFVPDRETWMLDKLGVDGWQPEKFQVVDRYLPPERRNALDIGAHIGTSTVCMLTSLRFSHVAAFEPNKEAAECWKANTSERDLIQFTRFHEVALSDERGVLSLRMDDRIEGNTGGSYATDSHTPTDRNVLGIVPAMILDRMTMRRPIDFIKIDVEGMEARVLSGATETLRATNPVIMMEYKPKLCQRIGIAPSAAGEILTELDYRMIEQIGSDQIWSR